MQYEKSDVCLQIESLSLLSLISALWLCDKQVADIYVELNNMESEVVRVLKTYLFVIHIILLDSLLLLTGLETTVLIG